MKALTIELVIIDDNLYGAKARIFLLDYSEQNEEKCTSLCQLQSLPSKVEGLQIFELKNAQVGNKGDVEYFL